MRDKKVIISGGGIAGLTLALAIQHYCNERKTELPEITIYERDPTLSHRAYQGYSFSIRGGGGADVLKVLGLYDKCASHRTPGHSGRICEADMVPLMDLHLEMDGKTFRIPRYQLRNDLLEEIPKEWVRWDTACVNAEQFTKDGKQKVRVHLNNGSTDECDILVVADGTKSKLGEKLMKPEHYKLNYEGAMQLSGRSKVEKLPQKLLEAFYMILTPGTCCFIASVTNTEAVWGITYLSPQPDRDLRGDDPKQEMDTKATLEECKQRAKRFPDPVPFLVENTELSTLRVFPMMDRLPVPSILPNIVFIGDANHSMSPFSANGANMAMLDSLFLADQLTDSKHQTLNSVLDAFDKETKVRSTRAINNGRYGVKYFHTGNFFLRKLRNIVIRTSTFLIKHGRWVKHVLLSVLLSCGGYMVYNKFGKLLVESLKMK